MQLKIEANIDVIVGLVWLALFFGFMLILPRSAFWYYFVPLAAFWFRYLWVRCDRDDALLRADSLADSRSGAPRCYRTEGGICITDGTHHILIAGHDPDTPLQLPHIVGHE